jgi:hypothetical protein
MRVAAKTTGDARLTPLPLALDDAGLAHRVRHAPSTDEAWTQLGFPGGRADVDPAVLARLLEAATAVCGISDAIGKGLSHFGSLAGDAPVPDAWVERMTELHAQELVAYFDLDDLAYEGLIAGGWTATTPGQNPPKPDPVKRIATRTRWEIEAVRPRGPALWLDRLLRGLAAQADPAEARRVGLHVLGVATRRHFSGWHTNTRRPARDAGRAGETT